MDSLSKPNRALWSPAAEVLISRRDRGEVAGVGVSDSGAACVLNESGSGRRPALRTNNDHDRNTRCWKCNKAHRCKFGYCYLPAPGGDWVHECEVCGSKWFFNLVGEMEPIVK